MLIRCGKCGLEKESYEFSRNRSTKTGFNYYCKECTKQSKKDYYIKNRDRIIEKSSTYYYSNKKSVIERIKGYTTRNRDKVCDYQKNYRLDNTNSIREQQRRYREENKDKVLRLRKDYYAKNRDTCITKSANYYKTNRDMVLAKRKPYFKEYYKTPCKFDSQYAEHLAAYEEVKESADGNLLVKCTYCGEFFVPTVLSVRGRLQAICGSVRGEGRFYCSDHCKKACPIFYQVLYPKDFKETTSREVQAQLRQLVLKRDEYKCQICGKNQHEVELHCHHIEGVKQNPIESADVDNCITLCKEHHKFVHSQKGCTTYDLKCKEKEEKLDVS